MALDSDARLVTGLGDGRLRMEVAEIDSFDRRVIVSGSERTVRVIAIGAKPFAQMGKLADAGVGNWNRPGAGLISPIPASDNGFGVAFTLALTLPLLKDRPDSFYEAIFA